MRYGFYLPTRGKTCTPDALSTLARQAEDWGFSSAVIGDHVVFPVTVKSQYPYTAGGVFPRGGPTMELLSIIAFLAGQTSTLRLATSVLIVPQRNPVVTAKVLATVDVLSKGRLTVGIGVGWLREEFEALGSRDFDRRGTVTDEYLRIFKLLWTGEPVSFSGNHYSFDEILCQPQPVQKPHPPIWVGGSSKPALRRAARFGDGWHPVGANPGVPLRPPEFCQSRDELFRLAEAEGRDPNAITISYKVPLSDPALRDYYVKEGERQPFAGSPEQIIDDIATFARLGVKEFIFDFRGNEIEESLEKMEQFSSIIGQTADL